MRKYLFTIWTTKEQEKNTMYPYLVLADSIEEAIEIGKRICGGFPFDIELESDYNEGLF